MIAGRNLKEIDQNVIFESTYSRDGWRDPMKAAMVLNGAEKKKIFN